jgi:hypothetical protein
MPDTSGATVFDDLPESIITQEIFSRLPSRDILRCGGVSKWWHGATSAKEFLVDHHRRQPSLPLAIFQPEDVVDALDIREAPPKRLPVLKYKICDNGLPLTIHASCDGLLLLSLRHGRFNIVNPATGQWLAIPRLTGSYGKIAGMYPHPHRSGKYGILFCRGGSEHHNAGYYVLTVGSSKRVNSKKPPHLWGKYLKPPEFSEIAKNHRFCVNWFQCTLIVKLSPVNSISDRWGPVSVLTWQGVYANKVKN